MELFLSVISVKFYKDIYNSYKGYGIRHIFNICFISGVIYSIILFGYMDGFRNYFLKNELNKYTFIIDFILKQLPELKYDGNVISTESSDQPIYLYDPNNRKIIAIDTENQLSYNEKLNIPVILTNKNIIISLIQNVTKEPKVISFEYKSIFGSVEQIINFDYIKKWGNVLFSSMDKKYIYVFMPITIMRIFISTLFEKSPIILFILMITTIFGPHLGFKKISRLILFSSSMPVLLYPIFSILWPSLANINIILQFITNSLALIAIIQINNNKINK
jgi:hypothetical protein